MKKFSLLTLFTLLFSSFLSSCTVVGGIFKAGMGFGIFVIIFIIALIGGIIFLISKKN